MKNNSKNGSSIGDTMLRPVLFSVALAGLVLGGGLATPAHAQDKQPAGRQQVEEVVVTARRKEENIQDVPISVSVYSQDQLNKANIVSGADLALYDPSLSANNRFGSDQSSFAIRGFTQELRTTASVGTYFAEVVAPRGSGLIAGGDGAGPGYFFDLQNVQVLKGPQGTLFGRNTTGGAILLTPQKPTDALEGYLELGAGNYNMQRAQGALNIPISDRVLTRFSFDTNKRDGYLKNVSGVGPSDFANVDYFTGRVSLVLDLTDSIENYTIASYTDSKNNGTIAALFACNDPNGAGQVALLSALCVEQMAAQGKDFYTVMSTNPDPVSKSKQWQVINTTTWSFSDDLTVKNILSYADQEQEISSVVFGTAWAANGTRVPFSESIPIPGIPSNSETSFVEELQFQGNAFDNKLTWQAGLYYENNKPDGPSGTVSPFFAACDPNPGNDPSQFSCFDGVRVALYESSGSDPGVTGNIQRGVAKVEYTSKAIYGESTYNFTDAFNVTLGLRYTEDQTEAEAQTIVYRDLPPYKLDPVTLDPIPYTGGPITLGPATDQECFINNTEANNCRYTANNGSEAVTGQITFNYYPIEQVMTYAKYSRGYRQASLNVLMAEGLLKFDPEHVNAYEIGAKNTIEGPVPGSLNISLFYNDLRGQQLQENVVSDTNQYVSTTAILNAGKSKIAGAELEAKLQFPWDMFMDLSYTYLDTKLQKYERKPLPPGSKYNSIQDTVVQGGELTFSPENNLTITLNQRLPVPLEWGDMSFGATYVFTDSQLSTANSPTYGRIPSYELWNFNFSWSHIASTNLDASLFITNAKDEHVTNYVNGLYSIVGNEYRIVGEPRMYGAKLRYTFD